MNSEKRMVEEILAKRRAGERLTEREERIVAYSPYGTAARSSFNPIEVDVYERGESQMER